MLQTPVQLRKEAERQARSDAMNRYIADAEPRADAIQALNARVQRYRVALVALTTALAASLAWAAWLGAGA